VVYWIAFDLDVPIISNPEGNRFDLWPYILELVLGLLLAIATRAALADFPLVQVFLIFLLLLALPDQLLKFFISLVAHNLLL
jgi:hypothetical protein